uniref:Uncharacterized protein n=1 Tax=Avena sativa TaxID=4498 RepID=A0ACD5WSR2_AVESA
MEAAATNNAALAALVAAASSAAKDAAVAASAAALNAKEAAATASAAALSAKEAAATSAAASLDAKDAAALAVAAGKVVAAAVAAMQASKKRKFHLIEDHPSGNGDFFIDNQDDPPGNVDLISCLPDAVLGTIVSLLPTKDGVRTQAISRRWRPIWRSAPLNLADGCDLYRKGARTSDLVPMILSQHPGPAHRFSICIYDNYHDEVGAWLTSQALDNLQELELTYSRGWLHRERPVYLLPPSAFRFAPTLRVAKLSGCHLPDSIVQLSLKFPFLKQLSLVQVSSSEDVFQTIFSGCPALESLVLINNFGMARLCISSAQTIKSIGFCSDRRNKGVFLQELVVEDAPCLERLLPLNPTNGPPIIRIISAPKLKILGMLSGDIAQLQLGTNVFQKMIAVGLTTEIHTVRILVLCSAHLNLDTVLNFLKCFPFLEKLYFNFQPGMGMDTVQMHDPLEPIECLELHLKQVVLKNYDGTITSCIDFTKFFVLNAKVLKEMKITLAYHRQHKWFAKQRSLLQIKNRASRDAQIELKCGTSVFVARSSDTHDLSMADPFDVPSSACSKCTELMRKKSLLLR